MTTEQQSTSEPPDRIRLVKREGIFDGHWYYPDAAIMPFDAEFEYSRAPVDEVVPTVDDNDINAGVWFQSAVSGGWYRTRESAGSLSAVRVDGVRFVPSPNALCVCGHIRKVHEPFEDHDECMGCVKERDGLTEDQCSWFQAAPASPAAPQDEDELVDEVQHRMDQVVEAAVEWHQKGLEGEDSFEATEKLDTAINSLLELRSNLPIQNVDECFCGTDLEVGLCPNGHDPIRAAPSSQPIQDAAMKADKENE